MREKEREKGSEGEVCGVSRWLRWRLEEGRKHPLRKTGEKCKKRPQRRKKRRKERRL